MTFSDLKQALQLFGLAERVSLAEIKERHRQLVRAHHPDQNPAATAETIRQINAAWEILAAYCGHYRFSFSEEEFLEQNPEERLRRQFASDPVWGGINNNKDD